MLSHKEKVERIKKCVHFPLDMAAFDSTMVQRYISCYPYAIGSVVLVDEIYRIGAISGRKPIDEKYSSIGEVVSLLYEDCETLDLRIARYSGEALSEREYLIRLIIKSYREEISDYHFLRCDSGIWTEKWRMQKPRVVEEKYYCYDSWPWREVGLYKITR